MAAIKNLVPFLLLASCPATSLAVNATNGTNATTLPVVDLGYEIYRAAGYNVSYSQALSPLAIIETRMANRV
jgi:hypothetical protein